VARATVWFPKTMKMKINGDFEGMENNVVWINTVQLKRFEKEIIRPLAKNPPEMYNFVNPRFYIDPRSPAADQVQYFLIGNTINFRYWTGYEETFNSPQGMKNGEVFKGTSYMWRCLKLWLDATPKLLTAEYLRDLPMVEFQAAFADDHKYDILPDLEQRLLNLHDLGTRLTIIPGGKFLTVMKEFGDAGEPIQISLQHYLSIIEVFRAYDDILAKLAMVNAIMLHGRGLAHVLNIFPGIDYHLPNMLFRLGILECNLQLQHDLETRTPVAQDVALMIRLAAMNAFTHMMEMTEIAGEFLDQLFYQNKACRDPALCELCPFVPACVKRTNYKFMLEPGTRYY
jgi:hypothetical protein